MCCIPSVSSQVQDAFLSMHNGMISATWAPPANPNGIIYQYIVERVNSSGTFYHHVPATQLTISLPPFNDALIFMTAVNLYGRSRSLRAVSTGNNVITADPLLYLSPCILVPCQPSPCINNGVCVNDRGASRCFCVTTFTGSYCEEVQVCSVNCSIQNMYELHVHHWVHSQSIYEHYICECLYMCSRPVYPSLL